MVGYGVIVELQLPCRFEGTVDEEPGIVLVETVEQLRLLRSLGCAKAQGFLISHPVPAEAMRSTVAALESLAQWPEFAQVVGGDPLDRAPIAGA